MAEANISAGLIDTDILIDALRGISDGVEFLANQHASSGVQISIISAMELVVGCRHSRELALLQQFLQKIKIFPINVAISQKAYQLMELYFLSHGLLIPDALIAATALEHGLTLYTKNIRHFQMIPELQLLRPY
jgi:predicted nucleic acid-binding protein